MTPQQITLVQQSFEQVAPIADTAAELFYGRLFDLNPEFRPMFKGDIRKQGAMLMQTLALAVTHLHEPEQIIGKVEALGRRHNDYEVEPDHYPAVGAALLWTLSQGLGNAFTDDVREAWAAAYQMLSDIMIRAAAQAKVS